MARKKNPIPPEHVEEHAEVDAFLQALDFISKLLNRKTEKKKSKPAAGLTVDQIVAAAPDLSNLSKRMNSISQPTEIEIFNAFHEELGKRKNHRYKVDSKGVIAALDEREAYIKEISSGQEHFSFKKNSKRASDSLLSKSKKKCKLR